MIDAIVHAHAEAMAKYTAKLKIELCADIQARVKVITTGLIRAHADVDIPDIATRVKAEASITISGKVDADAKAMVQNKLRGHARKIIAMYCVRGDDQCLNRQAKPIAKDIKGHVRRDIGTLFASYKRHLVGNVRAHIIVRDLSVNLLLKQIHVQATSMLQPS